MKPQTKRILRDLARKKRKRTDGENSDGLKELDRVAPVFFGSPKDSFRKVKPMPSKKGGSGG